MNNFVVYKHTSPSKKVYIGITNQTPSRRWRNGKGYSQNLHFYNAIQKYGWKNFSHEILYEGLTKEEACKIETELIQKYHSFDFRFGYNRSLGGEHGLLGEQAKHKISESVTDLWKSEEYRQHMSDVHKGRGISGWHHTDEAKAKMRNAVTERCKDKAYTKRLSETAKQRHKKDPEQCVKAARALWDNEQARQHIIDTKKGNHYRAKKVICIETGEVFISTLDAAKSVNASRESIGQCCRGIREMSHGYHWKFADE